MFSVDDLDFNLDDENDPLDTSFGNLGPIPEAQKRPDLFRKPTGTPSSTPAVKRGVVTPLKTSTPSKANIPERREFNREIVTKAVRRKFPGPAGLLPDKPPRSFNDSSILLENAEQEADASEEPLFCSQASELVFSEPPFKKLRRDFDIDQPNSPLRTFTVDWVKKRALSHGLKGRKIPFLAVILQSVDCSSADPLVTLRDSSGELFGALHREVWKEMGAKLKPGAAIALKEVGVLSTGVSRRQVILIITKNNIVNIYCPDEDGDVLTDSVQPTTCAEIVHSVLDWQTKVVNSPARSEKLKNTVPNLFQTIASPSASNAYRQFSAPKVVPTINPRDGPSSAKHMDEPSANESINFDLCDEDFADLDESQFSQPDLIISSTQNEAPTISKPVPNKLPQFTTPHLNNSRYCSSQVLSQAETNILDEVLNGVDLEDFE